MRGVHAAMQRGELSYDHARVMVQETARLDPTSTMAVAQRVLDDLSRRARGREERLRLAAQRAEDLASSAEGRDPAVIEVDEVSLGAVAGTPGRLRRLVRAAVIRHEPLSAELAAQQASAERAVSRDVLPDAQAMLRITGPAIDIASIWTALDLRAGRSAADDPRTLDQRRFDALVDLCTEATSGVVGSAATDRSAMPGLDVAPGAAPILQRPRSAALRVGLAPGVYVFADAPTWAGLADGPVELDGYGPVPAGVAREHFESSTWRVLVTDTVTGAAVAVSDATYRPSVRTRRLLHARDRSCAFPGCHAAIWFCDADHGVPHEQGGCTDADNCGLLCRRHHRLKTFGRWRWRRLPDGAMEWTDPNGRTWVRYGPTYDLPPPPLPYLDAPPGTDVPETLPPARGSPTTEAAPEPPPPF
jgi:hypothetical protein